MMVYNFDRIFRARGIYMPFAFLRKHGFSDSFASKAKNGRVSRLNLDIIERLCIVLRCTPNDLMEWAPDSKNEVDHDHPINLIRKSDKEVDITKTLSSVPLGQLDEVDELINKFLEEKMLKQLKK
jgi:DNA-binding Xre family transcriptional regulator